MKNVTFPETVQSDYSDTTGKVYANEWQKGNLHRLYVDIKFSDGGIVKAGYVDLNSGEIVFTKRGVDGDRDWETFPVVSL